jgi:cyclopropane-fatty-acyl-phospholipid synthase
MPRYATVQGPVDSADHTSVPRGDGHGLIRHLFSWACRHLTADVPFRVIYWDGTSDCYGGSRPEFCIRIKDPGTAWRIIRAPDPEWGNAYVAGHVEVDNLDRLLEAHARVMPSGLSRFLLSPWLPAATPVSQQYQDIQAHYDRGDAFFSLWLDRSLTYSCAYFRDAAEDLETAQQAKIDHVLRKAQLQPGQSLLDIGSGWGALIRLAAQHYGVRAHGITLSRAQCEFTRRAIHSAGLESRAQVDLLDYRQLASRHVTFDRIVSVGMLEHVGRKNLRVFLSAVRGLLRPQGVCVLHSITRPREMQVSRWMRMNIFPGSYIPSLREITDLLPELDFRLLDVESLRRHYALTVSHWSERFEAHLAEVRALGLGESFIRMWRLYLRGAIAQMTEGALDLHQFVFTRGINNHLPLTRDSLYS